MKKVLIIATVYSHIGQFHQPLIDMLKENGYEVHICGYNNLDSKNGLKISNVDKEFDLPFSRNPFSLKNINCYKKLKKIIATEKYNIVHCNTPVGGVIGRLAAKNSRKNGTKVLYTAHGFHFYKGSSIKNWLIYYPIEKVMARYTDTIITINKEDYELSKNKFKGCGNFLYINGVGVDEKKYNIFLDNKKKLKYIQELGIKERDFIIICIGELNSNKNQKLAIEAMKKITKNNPNIKLWLLGNGPNKSKYENIISKYNLKDNIKLLGYRRDVPELIQLSNIGLSCSIREGLGLNLIEELIGGKPVIGVDNRGHREIIENDVNGVLIDNNVDQLVKAINNMVTNTTQYNRFKANSSKSVKKFFISKVLIKLKDLYT